MNDHIHLNKIEVKGKDACETSMYGDVQSLSSLVYSAMKSNEKFAEIVINAASNFVIDIKRQEAFN